MIVMVVVALSHFCGSLTLSFDLFLVSVLLLSVSTQGSRIHSRLKPSETSALLLEPSAMAHCSAASATRASNTSFASCAATLARQNTMLNHRMIQVE